VLRPGVAFRAVTLSSEAGDPQQAPRVDGAEGTGETGNETPIAGAASGGAAGGGAAGGGAAGGGTAAKDGGSVGLLPPGDRGNPGARLPEDGANPGPPRPAGTGDAGPLPPEGGNPSAGLPEGGANPRPPRPAGTGDPGPLPLEGGNPGPLWPADTGDAGPLPPGNGSHPGPPPAPSAPAAEPTRPVQAGRHRRRRPLARKADRRPRLRLRLHAALTALAAFLVIVTVVLVATDNGGPPAPNGTAAQQPGPVTEPSGQIAPPPNYKLAFSTDFPGTALDTSTWAQCYPWSPAPPGCSNFGNADEREWYLPSQVHVDNGLALVAQQTPTQGSDENGNPKTYTCRSGMVTTYPSAHLKYGFVQVTARLPFGKGLWPAIWLIPADQSWPPEIDIVEHWDTQPTARATLHYGKQNSQELGTVNFPDADKGWHTYTLYWIQSRISIYYDNQLALTTTAHIPQQTMYLLLDLADENNTPGSCSGTMYVKSVNIWKPPPTPATG
jgi:Glycosyl hydrolases family 16